MTNLHALAVGSLICAVSVCTVSLCAVNMFVVWVNARLPPVLEVQPRVLQLAVCGDGTCVALRTFSIHKGQIQQQQGL